MVRVITLLSLFLMLSATVAVAEVYQYRDKNGQLHFTDRLSEVPEGQRPPVQKDTDSNAGPEGVDGYRSDRVAFETVKPSDDQGEAPQDKSTDKKVEIPIVEEINKEKASLDKSHAQLMKRKKALKKERETLKTAEQVRVYRKKVARLNKEIDLYAKRNRAFQKKADLYNEAAREKGEE